MKLMSIIGKLFMQNERIKNILSVILESNCLKLRQIANVTPLVLVILSLCNFSTLSSLRADTVNETHEANELYESSSYASKIPYRNKASSNKKSSGRAPANFVPDDHIQSKPMEQEIWLENVFVEDKAGVLVSIKKDFEKWRETEEYRKLWDIKSTGLYETPDSQQKNNYFFKRILKYADKRLSGEIKQAEEGSTLHRVGQIEKAVKPETEAKITDNIKLSLKARVLQGRAIVLVKNPYVDCHANVDMDGSVDVHVKKDLEDLGVSAELTYRVDEKSYEARFDRKLTDKVRASLTRKQYDGNDPYRQSDDNRLKFVYSTVF